MLVCGRDGSDGVDDAASCDQQKYAGITMLAIIAGGWLVWLLSVYKFGGNDGMEDIVGLFSIFALSVHPPRTPGARSRLVSTPSRTLAVTACSFFVFLATGFFWQQSIFSSTPATCGAITPVLDWLTIVTFILTCLCMVAFLVAAHNEAPLFATRLVLNVSCAWSHQVVT